MASDNFQFWEILCVDETDWKLVAVNDDQVLDVVLLEEPERIDGQHVGRNLLGLSRHKGADGLFEKIGSRKGRSPEVPVGENTGQLGVLFVNKGEATGSCVGHRENSLFDRSVFGEARETVAGAHDVTHFQKETHSERASWMETGKIIPGQAAFIEVNHGERVADGHGRSRAGGRCQL